MGPQKTEQKNDRRPLAERIDAIIDTLGAFGSASRQKAEPLLALGALVSAQRELAVLIDELTSSAAVLATTDPALLRAITNAHFKSDVLEDFHTLCSWTALDTTREFSRPYGSPHFGPRLKTENYQKFLQAGFCEAVGWRKETRGFRYYRTMRVYRLTELGVAVGRALGFDGTAR